MKTFTFDNYFDWLMGWEGTVYENDPDDPGGATKFGIDQRSHPSVNIRALTREKAKQIYFDEYWRPVAGDKLPPRTALAVMDCAVNNGRTQAAKWLQRTLVTNDDGIIGSVTLRLAAAADDRWAALQVLKRREALYRDLAKKDRNRKFLKGWLNRNNDLAAILS